MGNGHSTSLPAPLAASVHSRGRKLTDFFTSSLLHGNYAPPVKFGHEMESIFLLFGAVFCCQAGD